MILSRLSQYAFSFSVMLHRRLYGGVNKLRQIAVYFFAFFRGNASRANSGIFLLQGIGTPERPISSDGWLSTARARRVH
jgi:hypothetical protein